ncbi:MAG: protein-L-isoaspartate(D-aspartate) O-methyltransferase [Pseudomonadales bacterium]
MNNIQLSGIGMTSERTRDRLVQRLREQGITDERVLEVMRSTPRHIFLDEALAHRAYEDCALPIGYEQTLSQPYIVARMTELLLTDGIPEKVLEIGTGSGYQTAVLAQLVPQVFTVERIKPLQEKARQRMRMLKLRNIDYMHADGYAGWNSSAPFDAILASAAPSEIPASFIEQLTPSGLLVLPVGNDVQELQLVRKKAAGIEISNREAVRFVPLKAGLGRA